MVKYIYSDGSYKDKTKLGKWAYIVVENDEIVKEVSDIEYPATVNRMELMAAIRALEDHTGEEIHIHVDSMYVYKGITEWIHNWRAREWKEIRKTNLKNIDLWKRLDFAVAKNYVQWHKVKAHSRHKYNSKVDKIASSH